MTDQQEDENYTGVSEGVDITLLSDEVYRLLLLELRIERERQRVTSGRPLHSRRTR
jgi:hypothetical protein